MCGGPLLPKDMVTGRAIVECKTLRNNDNECGKNAHWFEPKRNTEKNLHQLELEFYKREWFASTEEIARLSYYLAKKPFWARLLG